MSVPNTTTFNLQDVIDAVQPTTNDLVDCFADAISGNFDATYSGTKTNLLNFRNYNVTPVSFGVTNAYASSALACGSSFIVNALYFNNNVINIADTAYTNSNLTIIFNNNQGYYKVISLNKAIYIDNNGIITNITNC